VTTVHQLLPAAPWVRLDASGSDWEEADPQLLRTMLVQLRLIRAFEEKVLELAGQGLVHGPAHSSIGQEGGAVGSILALRPDDAVNGSHRGHHQFLAKALGFALPGGFDPAQPFGLRVEEILYKTLAEILGLAPGYCRGRGGSMHLQWKAAGALGTNAIVGGGVPLAMGNAWAQKWSGSDAVSVSYFGDGAVNIGSVLESMNLAAAWKLPVCFFIENNGYAVSTTVDEATAEHRLSARGLAFGIPSWQVDGMDSLAVYKAMEAAVAHMRAGGGPTIVEAEVYRYFHQNGPLPGSAFGYRPKAEEQSWKDRDPIAMVEHSLLVRNLAARDELDRLDVACAEAMARAEAALVELDPAQGGKRRIRPAFWPDPGFADVGVRGDLAELAGAAICERDTYNGIVRAGKFIDVVSAVMGRRMETDPRVFVLGEDVHRLKGGTNGATRGLAERFPDRILGTPISENAFVGLAGGAAMDGRCRPVVEFMYPDFLWVAADQVFNQIGKARHMFGGDDGVPLVLRTKVAMGTGYGSQHSMDPAGIFATAPGWRIAAASTAFDYVGLMNTAIALDDPVLIIEHVDLYARDCEIPVSDLDYQLPFGRAAIRRSGQAVTVLTYLSMVSHSLEAVEQSSIDAEIVDLRWLDRASLDWETIETSIRKTNCVLLVEQGAIGTSYGGWLADEIQRRFFDWLDAPVLRVTGREASPSISKILERAATARTEEVVEALHAAIAEKGGRR
jgi:2-oxoisovalerate dehydrogenase E1 component